MTELLYVATAILVLLLISFSKLLARSSKVTQLVEQGETDRGNAPDLQNSVKKEHQIWSIEWYSVS